MMVIFFDTKKWLNIGTMNMKENKKKRKKGSRKRRKKGEEVNLGNMWKRICFGTSLGRRIMTVQ